MKSSTYYGYSAILSRESAVGLIMAQGMYYVDMLYHNTKKTIHICTYTYTYGSFIMLMLYAYVCLYVCIYIGNTGRSLSLSYSQTRVYFSHDGGFSWQEVNLYVCIH